MTSGYPRNSMETDDPQSQGRIVTENASLLALLRENTADRNGQTNMTSNNNDKNHGRSSGNHADQSVHKVYVETPPSNRTDEEYHFVDPNVENLEDSQDFSNRDEHRQHQSGRYENRNDEDYREPQSRTQQVPSRTQYVLRPKRNSAGQEVPPKGNPAQPFYRQQTPEQGVPQDAPHFVKPIQSPLSRAAQLASREEQAELTALREEQQYQQHLREKILEQSKETDEIQIPRLALEALEDEEKAAVPGHPLHDSLEDEYIMGDSLQERQAKAVLHKTQQQLQELQEQQMQTQQQLQHLQQQQQQQQQEQQLQTQQQLQQIQQQQLQASTNFVQDSLEFPQGSVVQYQEPVQYQQASPTHHANPQVPEATNQYYGQGQQPYHNQQGQGNGAHGFTNPQSDYDIDYYGDQLGANGQLDPSSQGYPGYDATAQPSGAANAQYYDGQGYVVSAPLAIHSPTQPSSVTSLRPEQPLSPKHNFIRENKEVLATGLKKSTYKKLYANQKELKDRPPIAPKRKTPDQQVPGSQVTSAPQSAEHLWAERAQRLEQQKQQKLTKVLGKAPLKKYPSESGVNVMRDSAASTRSGPVVFGGQKAPHHVQAHRGPVPRRSIAEPIRSQVHMQSPDQPIRHTIVTEDGQQLSVDINLKVLSPTPESRLGQNDSPPVNHPPHGVELRTQAVPTLYQQNPAAFRPHIPRVSPRQAFVHQEGPPLQQHQMPPGNYGSPVGNYGSPAGNYGAPPSNYGAPPSNYGNPLGVYGSQASSYGTPASSYGNPPNNYGNPVGYVAQAQVPPGYEFVDDYMNNPQMSPHMASPHPSQQSTTPINSPYKVLPPIGSADTDQGRQGAGGNSPGTNGDGYMAHYKQQRTKKQEYTEYTLDDYRKLKKEISLGGLGPDIDNETIKEKREKRQRQLDYAKSLKQRPPGLSSGKQALPPGADAEEYDALDRRKVALEYAKSIPKPKPRSVNEHGPSGISSRNSGASNTSTNHKQELEVFDLEKLRQRHEKERQQVSMIRQNMEHYSQA